MTRGIFKYLIRRMFEKDASFLAQSLAQRNALARLIHRQAETVASAAGVRWPVASSLDP